MLYQHQKEAVELALKNNGRLALFHDPGCGKTRTSLEIFTILRQTHPDLKMLVVCPLSLINAAWGCDTAKFTAFKYKPLADLKPGELAKTDIVSINFESLIVEKRLKAVEAMLAQGKWIMVVDESSRMKNHKSQTSKALMRLRDNADFRLIASGTPAPNSEVEFYAQIKFIDPTLLPDSFYAFRNTYFHLGRGNQVMHTQGRVMTRALMSQVFQQGWKYQITAENRESLLRQISPVCHWVKKEDALDLPEKIDEIRLVKLNPNERRAYNDMKNHLVAEIKTGRQVSGQQETQFVTAEVALAKLMKLRQMTSGFAYDENHVALRPGRSSKMRELEDVLEELGNRQVIIWVQFHEEVEAISDLIKKAGKTFTTLYAGTPDKDTAIKDFQEGRAQYLIAHPRSAAHGLTFVNCSVAVFFSLDYSYEAHAQGRDRIHRIGQKNACLYIYLVAENTIDRMCLDVINRKKSLQDVYYELMKEG